MNNTDNIIALIRVGKKWKKTILTLTLLAGIISATATWVLLKNYYQSTTIFYAASLDMQKPDKLFGVSSETVYYYGTPDDLNRILAIAESAELRDYLTKRFGLYARYEFDSTTQKSKHDFQEHFKELYKVEKNKLDAIELSMEDTDPEFAQKITLAARDFINNRANEIIKLNQTKILEGFSASLKQQELEIKNIEDSLKVLRNNYGIYNTLTQSKILTDLSSMAQAKLARYSAQVRALEKEPNASRDTIIMMRSLVKGLENELAVLNKSNTGGLNKGIGVIEVLEQMHTQKSKQLSYDAVRFEQLRATQKADIAAIYIVEEPRVPLIKSRPKRSLIVLAAMFATFVFTILGVVLLENYKKIDWNSMNNVD
jgi:capsule polysaccharide export protein KpsE/RkpR